MGVGCSDYGHRALVRSALFCEVHVVLARRWRGGCSLAAAPRYLLLAAGEEHGLHWKCGVAAGELAMRTDGGMVYGKRRRDR